MDSGKKTILMTADAAGGVWTYCADMVKIMSKENYHFHIVTTGPIPDDKQRNQLLATKNVRLYETPYKLEWMDNPWSDIEASGKYILQLEKEIRPDLVHLNSYCYATLPLRCPVIVVAHSDIFSWWQAVKKTAPGSEWNEYFQRVRKSLENTHCLVAPSRAMLTTFTTIYGRPRTSKVIYNGRDASAFNSAKEKSGIMSAGRLWDEGKNIQLLVRASHGVKEKIKVAGEMNDLHDFNGNIHFMGKLDQEEIAGELSKTLLYVAPAKYEPFGLGILEAALSGCVLILGNISSLQEIWGDSAMYTSTDDPDELTKLCNRFIADRELSAEYGRRAKEKAKLYSLEEMRRNYDELYTRLLMNKNKINKMQIA